MARMIFAFFVLAAFCIFENVQSYRASAPRYSAIATNQLFGRSDSRPVNRLQFKDEAPSSSALQMSTTSSSKRQALKTLAGVCKSYMKSILFTIKYMFDKLFSSLNPFGGAVSEAKALRNYREGLIAKKLAAEKLKAENKAKALAAMKARPPAAISLMSNEPVIPPPPERAPIVNPVVKAPAPNLSATIAPPKAVVSAGKAAYDAKVKAKKNYSPF